MAAVPARGFVRRAPGRVNPAQLVDPRMTDMRAQDAWWWDTRLGPHHVSLRSRADRYWSWSTLLPMAHFTQFLKSRACRPLVIWARADNRQFLRVGMSILIERYPHLDVAAPGEAHFVWFISAADPRVLATHFQMSNPPALARVHLDNAIVLSLNAGLLGRIGLHAARGGGLKLLAIYQKCGLRALARAAVLPRGVRRSNDGRFFYSDAAIALTLAQNLDRYR